jgi:anthranilate phosphoribosyltransferase
MTTSLLPDASAPLSAADAHVAFEAMLDGAASDEAIRDFLLAMSLRDETAVEIDDPRHRARGCHRRLRHRRRHVE